MGIHQLARRIPGLLRCCSPPVTSGILEHGQCRSCLYSLSARFQVARQTPATLIARLFLQLLVIFITSLATKYWQVFLSRGLCQGLGDGSIFPPTIAVSSTYFTKKRSLAILCATCGAATVGLYFLLSHSKLPPKLGFAWTVENNRPTCRIGRHLRSSRTLFSPLEFSRPCGESTLLITTFVTHPYVVRGTRLHKSIDQSVQSRSQSHFSIHFSYYHSHPEQCSCAQPSDSPTLSRSIMRCPKPHPHCLLRQSPSPHLTCDVFIRIVNSPSLSYSAFLKLACRLCFPATPANSITNLY